MLFNSFDFGLFLVIVYTIYWIIGARRIQVQNIWLLAASYFFYAFWDWRFLSLLILSSLVDYLVGIKIAETPKKRSKKLLLWCSILWNIGVLFTFKYFGFFLENFQALFQIEIDAKYNFWNVAIPLGLSFYTFQTLSYSIDIYQKKIKPTRNLLHFLCFVSFFPQLIAGPIERAKKMIPQFAKQRKFDLNTSKDGLRQILWGLFKKIIVAEKLGVAVDMVYAAPEDYHFVTILYAALLFFFQIYCDFSGYTDIALGTAKLFGFKLSRNFNLPYIARTATDFWSRWHITLTQWFTNYVYLPLAKRLGNKTLLKTGAVMLTMTLIGFWHGASWNFIFFGMASGISIVQEQIIINKKGKTLREFLFQNRVISLLYTYASYIILALIFRAQNGNQLITLFKKILSFDTNGLFNSLIGWKVGFLLFMIIAEVTFRTKDHPFVSFEKWMPQPVRWAIYYMLIFIIIRYAEPKQVFIYFQF